MIHAMICAIIISGLSGAQADTVQVTVGDTGCIGRQNSIKGLWEKVPGVVSITVIPRQPKDPAAQRVFVIVSEAAPPKEDSLREALGRRAKQFPILKYQNPPPVAVPSPSATKRG